MTCAEIVVIKTWDLAEVGLTDWFQVAASLARCALSAAADRDLEDAELFSEASKLALTLSQTETESKELARAQTENQNLH